MKNRLKVGITFGDVAGIGPEIIYKAFCSPKLNKNADYIFFGDKKSFFEMSKIFPDKKLLLNFAFAKDLKIFNSEMFECGKISFKYGKPSISAANAAVKWVEHAVYSFKQGLIDGIVTAPINKASCYSANFKFKGHTDFIASMFPNCFHKMAFYSKKIKVVLHSHHVSLKDAIKNISVKSVLNTIILADEWMKKLKIVNHKIFLSGLNPHAGEDGAFGNEESLLLIPAMEEAKRKKINVSGPYPPDVVFRKAIKDKNSIVIAMYHDQGLIPFKLAAFDEGVNVTIGLPLIRTSPDHGTAYDIAMQKKASESSMIESINLCIKLLKK